MRARWTVECTAGEVRPALAAAIPELIFSTLSIVICRDLYSFGDFFIRSPGPY